MASDNRSQVHPSTADQIKTTSLANSVIAEQCQSSIDDNNSEIKLRMSKKLATNRGRPLKNFGLLLERAFGEHGLLEKELRVKAAEPVLVTYLKPGPTVLGLGYTNDVLQNSKKLNEPSNSCLRSACGDGSARTLGQRRSSSMFERRDAHEACRGYAITKTKAARSARPCLRVRTKLRVRKR